MNNVAITIGGLDAPVAFAGLVAAGLVAAGLYQCNVTVPTLADGDHEVIAEIAGLASQQGVLLKVAN